MDTIGNQIAWRLGYLNILQGVIARLANSAAAMKAGSVAVLTGLLACAVGEQASFHWALFVLPGVLFMGFHAFFQQQERAFVQLYNTASDAPLAQVLSYRIDAARLAAVREPLLKVLCRPTVLAFHLPLVAGVVLVYRVVREASRCC
ncbi:hypothetical protein [Stenotrophomonas rhizophila]|uniref:hypothetical protein n=1 Tax=Stenotrophomonas rhizophila TaxID=216778 RepID=UPI00112F0CB0|nr:hypothetical protein [Stenotrophomonas rhizophila]